MPTKRACVGCSIYFKFSSGELFCFFCLFLVFLVSLDLELVIG